MYLNPFLFECLLFIPSILIYFIIIWILFSSKINKKLFLILFIIFFGLFLFYIFYSLDIGWPYGNYTKIPLTKMQIINRYFAFLHVMLNTFPYISIIIIPLIIALGIIYYKKTPDKTFLKKSCFISVVITLILYLGFPYSTYEMFPPYFYTKYYNFLKYFNVENKDLIKIHKFAADKAFIKGIKGFLSEYTAVYIGMEISKKTHFYSNNLSSQEVQKLMDEYIKYQKQASDLIGYDGYIQIVQNCDAYKRYDDALKYAYLAKSYGANIDDYIAHLYNLKKEYNKALDIINTGTQIMQKTKVRTYIGLQEYEKALEECNKPDKAFVVAKYKYESYIYYKQGNMKLAVQMFDEYKAKHRTKLSFDDFIKNTDEMF